MIFGIRPKPNHSTTSGAMATSGKVWLTISTGNSARRSDGKKSTSADSDEGGAQRAGKAETSVRGLWEWHSRPARRGSSSACTNTRDGAGSVEGLMPERRA